ncbi:hypothetical protein [Streptomyces kanamyceticus]|uniref:MmyB family transcriptional regulator n=1 Tax=Streptomyces kanamyceticus TaxID=1967 RepID=UPI0037DD1BDF
MGSPRGDPSQLREAERNILWLHFAGLSDCHVRKSADTEAFDASMVADLRRGAGRYPDDPQLHQLVTGLDEESEQFRTLWQRHEIAEHGPTVKGIAHPDVGRLDLDCHILTAQRGDLRIVRYTAEPGADHERGTVVEATPIPFVPASCSATCEPGASWIRRARGSRPTRTPLRCAQQCSARSSTARGLCPQEREQPGEALLDVRAS